VTNFPTAARETLLSAPDVSRLQSLRRSESLFSQGQTAEAAFLLEEGLVKLTRNNGNGGKIILGICGPGQMIGEECLLDNPEYYTDAEVLTAASVVRIPRESLKRTLHENSSVGDALASYLLERKLSLAVKVELLCLHDVQFRILHYLAELTALVKPTVDSSAPVSTSGEQDGNAGGPNQEFQIPITQLELADLIGATRETTSTTLNQLERRGLVKLSRRLLTVPSPVKLRSAAIEKGIPAATVNGIV
jgi:CRP-like cAMP-binding protein